VYYKWTRKLPEAMKNELYHAGKPVPEWAIPEENGYTNYGGVGWYYGGDPIWFQYCSWII